MARPKSDGLHYFSFDTDFFYADSRIKALRARYGSDGIILYIYLLTEIYRNGYYMVWNQDSEDNLIADLTLSEGLIKQIMTFLVSRSLLTQISILANPDTIITSPGIQKRYQEAVKSLKRDIFVDKDIWLLDDKETAACIKVTINEDNSQKNHSKSKNNNDKSVKNDTKEIKRNKKKRNEIKGNENKTDDASLYFPYDDKLNQAFLDYIRNRKEIKKTMTGRAIELAVKKLTAMSSTEGVMDNDMAVEILERSIMNGWQGLFPLNEDKNRQQRSGMDWGKV